MHICTLAQAGSVTETWPQERQICSTTSALLMLEEEQAGLDDALFISCCMPISAIACSADHVRKPLDNNRTFEVGD